jgi:TPR repeat protein
MALVIATPSWGFAASATGPGSAVEAASAAFHRIGSGQVSDPASAPINASDVGIDTRRRAEPLDLTAPGPQPLRLAQASRPRPRTPAPRSAGLEAAALRGDRSALSEIIRQHREGLYRPRRLSALVPLYAQRAREGQAGAAVLLGRIYSRGALGRSNLKTASEWYRLAAGAGSNEALKELAIMQARAGRDTEALRYARQHEGGNTAKASAYIARLFLTGREVPRDVSIARKWAIRTAAADPRLGVGVIGDLLDADLSLESLDALSKTLTATRLTTGLPLENIRDLLRQLPAASKGESTLQRFHKAAHSGNPLAALVIGEMIAAERGPGDEEALRLFATAAKEPRAAPVVALMAALAMTNADDPATAKLIGYLQDASAAGNPHAMKALAKLYALGGPVAADPAMSLQWYRKAALKGDPEGAFHTGLAYLLGTGTDQNATEALRWLNQASKGGNTMAKMFSAQITLPKAKPTKAKRS